MPGRSHRDRGSDGSRDAFREGLSRLPSLLQARIRLVGHTDRSAHPFTEFFPRGVSNAPMLRLLLPLLLSCAGFAHAAETRTLRAGDTRLDIAVVGVTDPARAAMLQDWIAEAARAPLAVSGRFPLQAARVEIRQRHGADASPVPWGQTSRRDEQVRVLLYVRDDASLDELRGDWTAVHELSHLFHPFLGARGRWLAEGLASYYQNVLRARVGLIEPREAWRELAAGFGRGRGAVEGVRLDHLGRRRGGTMRVYWAGAAFWLQADLALRLEHGSSLDTVLARYARCCLAGAERANPQAFVADLDRVADAGGLFERLYLRYAASERFPSLDEAWRQLGIEASGAGLRFSDEAAPARLRDAIMARRDVRASALPGPRREAP